MGSFPDLMSCGSVDPNSPVYGKGFIFRQANIPFLKRAAKRARREQLKLDMESSQRLKWIQ